MGWLARLFGKLPETPPSQPNSDMPSSIATAKRVLRANEVGPFGIFGAIGLSGYFPPRQFLNEFLMKGFDSCDQDRQMSDWQPFAVTDEDYQEIKAWWVADHEGAIEDRLGTECWDDWVQEVLNR
jgi:hypothetical protein